MYGITAFWVDEGNRSRFLFILFSVASDLADRTIYISKGEVIGLSGLMLLLNWAKPVQTKEAKELFRSNTANIKVFSRISLVD